MRRYSGGMATQGNAIEVVAAVVPWRLVVAGDVMVTRREVRGEVIEVRRPIVGVRFSAGSAHYTVIEPAFPDGVEWVCPVEWAPTIEVGS
jgi:hypothetical protein